MPHLSSLTIYPIKSLGGIEVETALLTRRGLQYDRRWMLVDGTGRFLSQRELPAMALLQPLIQDDQLLVKDRRDRQASLDLPLRPAPNGAVVEVQIFDDTCLALEVSPAANRWFSQALGMECRLVYMPDHSYRLVDPNYAGPNDVVSFADGFPLLLTSQESLADLNQRLPNPVPMTRFRPNLVLEGSPAWAEDHWTSFGLGAAQFYHTKPCGRCQVIGIDQNSAQTGPEPLRTLGTFRRNNNKVLFGLNVCWQHQGAPDGSVELRLGAALTLPGE